MVLAFFFLSSWRHHSNPVGTHWKWKMDPPEKIVEDAIQQHTNMIKQMKGANISLYACAFIKAYLLSRGSFHLFLVVVVYLCV